MGTAKKKNPKGEKVKRTLEFKLTDKEKAEKGELAGKLNKDLKAAEEKKTLEMKEHNANIKSLSSKVSTLLTEINKGTEKREVECVEVKNFDRKKVEWWFDGVIQGERDLTEEDKQLKLAENKKVLRKFQQPGTAAVVPPVDEKTAAIRKVHKLETGKNTAKSVLNN